MYREVDGKKKISLLFLIPQPANLPPQGQLMLLIIIY